MFSKINHVAIVSEHYAKSALFYQSVFGMGTSDKTRTARAQTVGDGYVGLNINPRREGTVAGVDHFGMLVDDVDEVLERMRAKHPGSNIIKRPSTRPFASFSGHDPDGNVFDLAQKKADTRTAIYAEQAESSWHQDRYINKFAIRTMHADAIADFYMDVFKFEPLNKKTDVAGHHMTDGRVTLSIMPWSIPIFDDMNIKRPGADHLGFKVENIDTFKQHIQHVAGENFHLSPVPLGGGKESEVRRKFFQNNATGKFQMADPDGNWIDVTDE
jgi:predicted enzyme related to lactoylglutathione lyase